MKKKPRARGAQKKKVHSHDPYHAIDPYALARIAEEESANVCEAGSPGASVHNAKTIAHAIKRALKELRASRNGKPI